MSHSPRILRGTLALCLLGPAMAVQWGAEAASHMPNSLHVVVPSGHGVFGPEVKRLDQAFLEQGSVEGLDLSEIERLPLPPLVLPGED